MAKAKILKEKEKIRMLKGKELKVGQKALQRSKNLAVSAGVDWVALEERQEIWMKKI